ncbi:alpha,alpha-trehalose-phosphate synthase (UDP-forming) [Methylobacterium haplocladii]|uniref:Alpha,alpha-trehalose-phosphate synthase (UDP-forming) n=1 Tax=Methylobacterium haplocladii TaxID=1176176 RepID=A0A512IRF8_9HYPH|nr:trehalose-6-phosphate synthase [Methylobacterium haplocladii]GEP00294.1 alpha,alpha-trehalose-phosphate synthase (UDP-forming) [Methylobacterium haplocladii]GJD83380.1 Trehalose-6-phosphate synthase [Methylobacterium haplocladii]GLS59784.1 alpha,alpha-trehalose-phosphate synthase (UDP-forming) [Methylobacterium haplocladii]
MSRLVIVSNRVAIPAEGKGLVSAGGLAVAVNEAFSAYEGLWFGWSGEITENPDPEPRLIDRGRVQYAVLDLSPQDYKEYYAGFANRALWPIMHYRVGLGSYSRSDYSGYQRVNRLFARALAKLLEPDDLVWVHDYHLIPLASELRGQGVDNPIGYFHHIPWPGADVFNTLPASGDLLRAIADYDLIGLQTDPDVQNLSRNLIDDLRAIPLGGGSLMVDGRRTRIRSFPIGIDVTGFKEAADKAGTNKIVRETMAGLRTRKLLIGVDRLDYSKGVPERMEAVDRFFASNPDQRGNVVYIQITPKSRSEVPEYEQLSRDVNEKVGDINGMLGEPAWTPIQYVTKAYPRPVLAGLYRAARVGLVTPMRDGMNLVAKEYVVAQSEDDPGVLVLSKFAGAARQMPEALLVNPYDRFEMAEAIREALYMPREERLARWKPMNERMKREDVDWWARNFMTELENFRTLDRSPPATVAAAE